MTTAHNDNPAPAVAAPAEGKEDIKTEQLKWALEMLNKDLEHAVSCMNRSCRKCNEIQRRFGPAQEGEGFRASTPPPAATVSRDLEGKLK